AWPGNVRELVNALERATILSSSRVLEANAFDAAAEGRTAVVESEAIAPLVDVERAHIERALTSTGGKLFGRGGAAELLGLKPTTLQSRMKKLGIRRLQKVKA
ncbi:MAG: DNA-binding NtrC family response regulator, partial [Myxococcota bacterium]